MASRKPYAIVLGLGGSNALGVTRSLGYEGIPVVGFGKTGRDNDASKSKYLRYSKTFSNEGELVNYLKDFGSKQDLKPVVFPTGDDYIELCSKNFNSLKNSFHLPFSPRGGLEKLIKKNKNNEFGTEAGFNVPRSSLLKEYDFKIEGPIIVKPSNSISWGKKDMKVYSDSDLLEREIEGILNKDPMALVQEYVPGGSDDLFEVHAYNDSSGPKIFGMQRNALGVEINPSVYVGAIFENVWEEDLVKPSLDLVSNLDFNGGLDVNLKRSAYDGKFYFMEVNFRTSANLSLDTALGRNLPLAIYNNFLDEGDEVKLEFDKDDIGSVWVHEPRILRYFGQGGSEEKLRSVLGNVRANFLHDSRDVQSSKEIEILRELGPIISKEILS